ncbi:hypothetical protein ES332_A05G386200v1 [Gossypium tomentosum]|uniref:glucose-6-phosphate dehydrogenase (NADP(+)) n=1 Tax=Gossypium tomentosum TaxID=34277 RepID=A0A5D2QPT5_GOSTO|nr:hypothetical protein ES332_A05G386200v1 [Gossypium tomentosum]
MRSSEWSYRSDSFWSNDNVAETGCLSIIVLGASGDLAKEKTFPALFHLYCQGFLPPSEVHILGYARTKISDDELRNRIAGLTDILIEPADIFSVREAVKYVSGSYDSAEGFQLLDKEIAMHEISKSSQEVSSRRLFYLALPPSVYPPVYRMIRKYCMNKYIKYFPADLSGWTRVVVEKPFGKDLDSAELLGSQIGELFDEPQIYRIDHYLGKELVQNLVINISSGRFANRFFLPLWNCDNIDNVRIVFREDFGTEGHGGYFDEYGIIRDIIQNHLLQVFCLVAMEKPVSLKPEHIRDEKVKVLQSVLPIKDEEVVLGQYEGYRDDVTVPDHSNTPTFATVILRIHNERWEGIPFILKAGKALKKGRYTCEKQGRNEFVIRLQPSEAMYMKLTMSYDQSYCFYECCFHVCRLSFMLQHVKQPGLEMSAVQSELDLSVMRLGQRYQGVMIREAYERLVLDTIRGDQQHFVRRDELKAAWKIFTPLLHRIDNEADELSAKAGYVQTHGYIWALPPHRNLL